MRNVLLNANEKVSGAILTLDFARAYDRVDRNVLHTILAKFGFSADFVKIVKIRYEGFQSQIIINGVLGDGIPMTSGLKQGCPLAALAGCETARTKLSYPIIAQAAG